MGKWMESKKENGNQFSQKVNDNESWNETTFIYL